MENIVSAAKTDVFRVRINPEIKQELESVYAKNGLTLTDAINVFFQQSLNAGGFPFSVTQSVANHDKCVCIAVFLGIPFSLVFNLTKSSSIAITIDVSISPP